MAHTNEHPQYKCVDVDIDLSSVNSNVPELLGWVNDCLRSDYRRLEELSNGAAYALFIDSLFPGTVALDKIEFESNQEYDSIRNFELVREALSRVGSKHEIPVNKLVKGCFQENIELLQWFKEFHDANRKQTSRDRLIENQAGDLESYANKSDRQLVVYRPYHQYAKGEDTKEDCKFDYIYDKSLIDHAWSRRVLEMVHNKSKLMESFSWLSTVGGGFSALGERDSKFSARAGALSLGQQLRLAELLGDERLRVMCHLFAALAALQLDNKMICLNYIRRVIIPLINAMPYRDPILTNILKHICFRISAFDRLVAGRQNAIEESRRHMADELETPESNG